MKEDQNERKTKQNKTKKEQKNTNANTHTDINTYDRNSNIYCLINDDENRHAMVAHARKKVHLFSMPRIAGSSVASYTVITSKRSSAVCVID